jgi:hypothetical protein
MPLKTTPNSVAPQTPPAATLGHRTGRRPGSGATGRLVWRGWRLACPLAPAAS